MIHKQICWLLFPLLCITLGYDEVELLNLNEIDSKTYFVTLKYKRKFESITNEFKVDYLVRRKETVNNLISMRIYDSKVY